MSTQDDSVFSSHTQASMRSQDSGYHSEKLHRTNAKGSNHLALPSRPRYSPTPDTLSSADSGHAASQASSSPYHHGASYQSSNWAPVVPYHPPALETPFAPNLGIVLSRPINDYESSAVWHFDYHGSHCRQCCEPYRAYRSHEHLCDTGHDLAREVCRFLYYRTDGKITGTMDHIPVEFPHGLPRVYGLLKAMESSLRHQNREPFVVMERAPHHDARNRGMNKIQLGQVEELSESEDEPRSERRGKNDSVKSRFRGSIYEEDLDSVRSLQSDGETVGSRERPSRESRKHRRKSVVNGRDPRASLWSAIQHEISGNGKYEAYEKGRYHGDSEDGESVSRSWAITKAGKSRKLLRQRQEYGSVTPESSIGYQDSNASGNELTHIFPKKKSSNRVAIIQTSKAADVSVRRNKTLDLDSGASKSALFQATVESCDESSDESDDDSSKPKLPWISSSKGTESECDMAGKLITNLSEKDPKGPECPEKLPATPASSNQIKMEDVAGEMTDTDTESAELQSEANNPEGLLSAAILRVKTLVLHDLLEYTIPEFTDALECSGTSNTQPGQSRNQIGITSSSQQTSEQPRRQKRSRGNGRDPGDGSDESGDDEDKRPSKRNDRGPPDGLPRRRLKCPFYQRQPEKYARAACRGEGFADMAKLKDHIKRVHTQPLRCYRCWREVESDEALVRHLQRNPACETLPEPPDDRISPRMLKRLDFKKAPYANARDTEQKWKILYSTLFPNDRDVPSPFEQHGMSPRLAKALSEALEEELTRELVPALEPILRRIKDRIPSIIENCKLRLMRMTPDEEVLYTPPSSNPTTSGASDRGTSDSEPAGQSVGTSQTSRSASRCSGSSFRGPTGSGDIPSNFLGKVAHRGGTPASSSSTYRLQEPCLTFSPQSSFDFSMAGSDMSLSPQQSQSRGDQPRDHRLPQEDFADLPQSNGFVNGGFNATDTNEFSDWPSIPGSFPSSEVDLGRLSGIQQGQKHASEFNGSPTSSNPFGSQPERGLGSGQALRQENPQEFFNSPSNRNQHPDSTFNFERAHESVENRGGSFTAPLMDERGPLSTDFNISQFLEDQNSWHL
ncbi:hypothetical protein K469DRAFT_751693 [Zopfia rhizophila CBS 207.26]|uniref:C2H2-type domain-containing protein n=1 Tax=Zopfia rhizophila CBS 207.26 TaxID=1314779 RepID=A0A6A6DZL6_9PEZI|nr:hypothetical protein K469DRAFT_751693 [Zopfia rhizophila CBS 207.26]